MVPNLSGSRFDGVGTLKELPVLQTFSTQLTATQVHLSIILKISRCINREDPPTTNQTPHPISVQLIMNTLYMKVCIIIIINHPQNTRRKEASRRRRASRIGRKSYQHSDVNKTFRSPGPLLPHMPKCLMQKSQEEKEVKRRLSASFAVAPAKRCETRRD